MTAWACTHGHEYTPENTYITPMGHRRCRTCNRDQQNRRRLENLAEGMAEKRVVTLAAPKVRVVNADTETWRDYALCAQADPEAFFPDKGGSALKPKRICASCEVRAQCLEYALANDERHGVWGGLSEHERRPLRRKQAS